MLAVLALFAVLFTPMPTSPALRRPVVAADRAVGDLRTSLARRFQDVDALKQGLFNQDITADVASFFPMGQPFNETQRIVAAQKLGALTRFKGEPDGEGVTMYVTHFNLVSEMFSHVYVVLDFDYEGTSEDDMRLKRMRAYLRAANM